LFILSHISSNSIYKKSGVDLDEKGNIKVDTEQKTNIEGVYAAGDCTGGVFQVVFATAEGARAGINACKYIRQLQKD
jgi:thioredoxin reductase (NADPH)